MNGQLGFRNAFADWRAERGRDGEGWPRRIDRRSLHAPCTQTRRRNRINCAYPVNADTHYM